MQVFLASQNIRTFLCVLKSFFGYFHPGVGFKAVSIKMLFKNVHIFQFSSLLIAKLVEPLLRLVWISNRQLVKCYTSFLIFFGHIVTVWDCVSKHGSDS